MEINENVCADDFLRANISYPKHYIKQIKIFSEEDCCNRWLRDKDPELIIDIKIESTAPYNDKVIMVIYMEEI